MPSKKAIFDELAAAVADKRTERGETGAIARILASHGYFDSPKVRVGKFGKGASVRIYWYEGTPAGDIVLLTGPSVNGELHKFSDLKMAAAPDGFYVEAVESTSSAAKRVKEQTSKAAARARDGGVKRKKKAKAKTKPKASKPKAPAHKKKTKKKAPGMGPPSRLPPPAGRPAFRPQETFTSDMAPTWDVEEEVVEAAPVAAGDSDEAMMQQFMAMFRQLRAEEAA